MNIYIYDDKKAKTEIIEIDDSKIEDNPDLEFFNDNDIRKVWHSGEEEWYLSIVDVVRFLTDSNDPKQYIKKMRQRDEELSSKWGTICTPLQMLGAERLDEIADPEKAMQRAVATYKAKGYSDKWITQRLRSIEIRKELTDEWQNSGISTSKEYAALTNILTMAWSGKSVQAYKKLKGLRKENLRDNMTNTELALNLLAEVSATELSKSKSPKGFDQTKEVTMAGGKIAGNAREELERQLGHSVLSSANAKEPDLLDDSEKEDD